MYSAHKRATARGWRALLCIAASLAAITFTTGLAESASAACTTGGLGCLPGSGYTSGRETIWNCGSIAAGVDCNSPSRESFGWGSAAYNGGGANVSVCVYGGSWFSGCGTNLIRACFYDNCNDQNSQTMSMIVENFSGSYVIYGHGLY